MHNNVKPGHIYTIEQEGVTAYTLILKVYPVIMAVLQFTDFLPGPNLPTLSYVRQEDLSEFGKLEATDYTRSMVRKTLEDHHFNLDHFEQLWDEIDKSTS